MRQKRFNFICTHVAQTPHGPAMAQTVNEKTYPIDVHLLSAEAIVHVTDALAQLVQNPGELQRRSAGFHSIFIAGYTSVYWVTSQATSHLQEGRMTNLWCSAQFIEQVLLWTLR